jgi:L-asparaginase
MATSPHLACRRALFVFLLAVTLTALSLSAQAEDKLPNVVILATGGTIAGTADSATEASYDPGVVLVETLIEAVPDLKQIANIKGEQVVNVASSKITDDIWLQLGKRANELLAGDVDGIVVTHGTDTLEETAYFLSLAVKSDKPVIVTGAMRPSTSISADGPVNLFNAVALAGDQSARGRGAMVVFNDIIYGARDVTKSHTVNPATFQSRNGGPLGYISFGKPAWFVAQSPRKSGADTAFDISTVDKLPKVEIVYQYVDAPGYFVDAAVANGAQGIVVAGTGEGSLSEGTTNALIEAIEKGVAVVRSSRSGAGNVSYYKKWDDEGMIPGNTLSPQKARILLALGLTLTKDRDELMAMFSEY